MNKKFRVILLKDAVVIKNFTGVPRFEWEYTTIKFPTKMKPEIEKMLTSFALNEADNKNVEVSFHRYLKLKDVVTKHSGNCIL